MREGQCYSCHMANHFQLYGQTKEWNEWHEKNASKLYLNVLEEMGSELKCISCNVKVKYTKNTDGIWDEKLIK